MKGDTLEIRSPVEDLDAVSSLLFRAWRFDAPKGIFFHYRSDWLRWAFSSPAQEPGLILGAYIEGRLVGFVWGWPVELRYGGRRVHAADVSLLSVDPEHRRRGIATALLNEGYSRLRERGYDLAYGFVYRARASRYVIRRWAGKERPLFKVGVARSYILPLRPHALASLKRMSPLRRFVLSRWKRRMEPAEASHEEFCPEELRLPRHVLGYYMGKETLSWYLSYGHLFATNSLWGLWHPVTLYFRGEEFPVAVLDALIPRYGEEQVNSLGREHFLKEEISEPWAVLYFHCGWPGRSVVKAAGFLPAGRRFTSFAISPTGKFGPSLYKEMMLPFR